MVYICMRCCKILQDSKTFFNSVCKSNYLHCKKKIPKIFDKICTSNDNFRWQDHNQDERGEGQAKTWIDTQFHISLDHQLSLLVYPNRFRGHVPCHGAPKKRERKLLERGVTYVKNTWVSKKKQMMEGGGRDWKIPTNLGTTVIH